MTGHSPGNDNTDNLYKTIGMLVRAARDTHGITQDDLAKRLGMARASIANIEAGRQRSSVHVFYLIADALDVLPHDLLPRSEDIGQFVRVTVGGLALTLTPLEAAELSRQLEGSRQP